MVTLKFHEGFFDNGDIHITIHDITGRVAGNGLVKNRELLQINTSTLTPGIYLVVAEQNGKRQTAKLSIQ